VPDARVTGPVVASKRFITKETAVTQTTTAVNFTPACARLYIALDMGRDAWHLAASDGTKTRREVKIDRTDLQAGKAELLAEVGRARARFALPDDAPVHVVYEAGRDGFWLARWLQDQGFTCIVIDPASILVDRKAKHRKNDAIDARALLDLLVRHVTGDRELQPVAVPPIEAEDARGLGRLLNTLGRNRRSLAARVQSLLWSRGIDTRYHTALPDQFDTMRTGDGRAIDPVLRLELDVLCNQIAYLDRDICRLEDERARQVQKPATPTQQQAHDLERLVGIGPIGAWTLAHELFGWREFANGKKLAAFVGLSPMPFASGTMQRDQGISKAGPGPLRALLVQLGWAWLRYQPDSDLAVWFRTRFGETAKRSKRVGIIAVARKLLLALWRYVTQGVVPAGARIKPAHHKTVPARARGITTARLEQMDFAQAA
jgi:transposase